MEKGVMGKLLENLRDKLQELFSVLFLCLLWLLLLPVNFLKREIEAGWRREMFSWLTLNKSKGERMKAKASQCLR